MTRPKPVSWSLDNIRLMVPVKPYYQGRDVLVYHARCEDILPHIETGAVQLLLTDPPYGMNLRVNYGGIGRQFVTKDNPATWGRVQGDDQPFDPEPLMRFDKKILFGANWYADRLPMSGGWIVWDKLDGLASKRSKDVQVLGFNDNSDAELAWTNMGRAIRIVRHRWTGMLKGSEIGSKRLHPTQKPVAMLMRLVEAFSDPGDLVLDPYAGSGSTAVACRKTDRRSIVVELEERYCEVIATRLQQQSLGLFDLEEEE
jgi:site-specific DNA-methyltransferase (adenine-specific)